MWIVDELTRRAGRRLTRFRQRIVPGTALGEPIDIARLMCPLRYDLWVRIGLVRLLREENALYHDDLPAFLNRAPVRAYYVWFREICCARYRPHLYRNPKLLEPAFIERVQETAKLQQSIDRNGFDASSPIRLMSGRSIHRVNGKKIDTRYFAGDGCHRIACLVAAGRTHLEPAHYEVAIHPSLEPLDNTAILARHLPLRSADYLRFLSHFYCDGAVYGSADRVLEHVAARRPELVPELESVLAYDLPRVSPDE